MTTATHSQFNNLSNEQLADDIGNASLMKKEWEEREEALKDEFKARDCSAARGQHFAVTVSETSSTRLDTKKLRADLGDALTPYETTTTSKRINVKAVPRLVEAA
jgi:predicted phage-related endonuclease